MYNIAQEMPAIALVLGGLLIVWEWALRRQREDSPLRDAEDELYCNIETDAW